MFDLLQALDLLQLSVTNLAVGAGLLLGAFAGTTLPASLAYAKPRR